ncbi:winged helix-turn-helix domain-containing protein [Sedimentitalea sp. JM2-8]|uniref:Winged helix-turn-helix domain-containing protein n=1 Tax=Sedimentitalea xiamensis TaxID=3050037 RepID=A0ABT7FJF1_9RHOB|nr:winged helix-turn-helix domain-containing protein [Sedimentitalea xiamensis]MDK3075271.1 winged helix-turn-helix domain-containing protein [Sedimentitalea xiamensis]
MYWRFGDYTLDLRTAELIGPDGQIHVERQTFAVLAHLIAHADRVVTRDELVEAVWDGRHVSDATVSTSIKLARRAVGDDGSTQNAIRTIHGRGFRFVAELEQPTPTRAATGPEATPCETPVDNDQPGAGRPSLAVLRFQSVGGEGLASQIASALAAELITCLSRIGWLHMIARGSSFRFDPDTADPAEIAAALSVRYLVTGMVETVGELATISVELQSADDFGLIWAERFACNLSDLQTQRSQIVSAIISSLELEIPKHESLSARKLSKAQFDAWTHFHLGITHLYRFDTGSNLVAGEHFDTAISLDPEFARAHAAKSFVHWQNAFMQLGEDRAQPISDAIAAAEKALTIDPREPFAAFNMARAKWLQGALEEGMDWFGRSLAINPNFAQSHYNLGLMQVLGGYAEDGAEASKTALRLSPLDPLAYAMFSTLALSAILRDDHQEAVRLSERANQEPGVHYFIPMIAAAANELAGNTATAERWAARTRQLRDDARAAHFFHSFPFRDEKYRQKLLSSFERLGFA